MTNMEGKSDMSDDYRQKKSCFSLFPAANQAEGLNTEKHSLFPSASTSVSGLSKPNKEDLSWLTNKSYTKDTEEKFVQFQQEVKQYQKKFSGDVQSADEKGPGEENEAAVDDKSPHVENKRQYISSDDSSDEKREQERKKKKKHKHKKKHKKNKQQDIESKEASRQSEQQETFPKNKIFLEELEDTPQTSAYRVDRSSDKNSWTYGSLYKPHIAQYKHFSPFCLGSAKSKQVLLYDIKKSSKHRPWDNRYFGKDNRSCLKYAGEQVYGSMIQQSGLMGTYIELKPAIKELEKTVTDIRQRILDESTSAYVKGEMAKQQFHSNTNTETLVKGPLERKVEEYNRKLREEPHNIELWLDFIKFQDVLFSEGEFGKDPSSKEAQKVKAGSQVLLDKKLSILDKAFEANPASIDLHMRKLRLCSEFWEPSRINKDLEQLLFVHPANVELWNYYLMFNQSRISIFTVSKMTRLYHKCFKTLFGFLEGKVQTHSVPDDLLARVLEIFYRYCLFLKESGYKEKALTSVQAMLEFNIFCPPPLKNVSREIKMAAFEEYWESGCPRLGCPRALGWKHWFDHKEQTSVVPASSEESLEEVEENIIEKKLLKHNTWLQIEVIRDMHHWLPWQPDVTKGQTEDDCEDPERLVVFDDISPVLFTVVENLHIELVNFFLIFSGMKLTSQHLVAVKSCCGKFCLNNPSLYDVLVGIDVLPFIENSHIIPESLKNLLILTLQQTIAVFKGYEQTLLTLMLLEFHMQMIRQGRKMLSKSDKKEIRKLVKNVLKEECNRNNLVIWQTYVTIERLIGKQGEADGIVETALAMHSGKDISIISGDVLGLLSLYRTYCEIILKMQIWGATLLWRRQETVPREIKQKVIQILGCVLENRKFVPNKLEVVSGTAQLRMRSKLKKLTETVVTRLTSASDATLQSTELRYFHELCVCSALFEYCSSGLESSQAVYQSARDLLQTSRLKGAQLLQTHAGLFREEIRLVLYHMTTVSLPLNVLRSCLDSALVQHPNESDFLRLFVDIENRSRIAGRLHRCFDQLTQSLTSPVPALAAISSQLEYLDRIKQLDTEGDMPSTKSGIVYKTRSWLERCLSQPAVQHCPLLWRLYFVLEKQFGDRARLKGLFYRSIQECPWVKELYLEGIQMFGDQLQDLVDMMAEKEIRVQIPVEELDILISD